MKVALIPPIPMLNAFGHGGFHLLLTHLLQDKKYFQHYSHQRDQGAYLVLDNSAHEKGEGEDAASLMASAIRIRAQEVVVPDVLFDSEKTIDRAVQTHEVWYEAGHPGMVTLNPALMYVPQGESPEAWEYCFTTLLGLHYYISRKHSIRMNCTLGISKDYEVWDGGLYGLIGRCAKDISHYADKGMNVQVHLLGWGRDLWALGGLRRYYPWIRSTDSAKPFVYGLKGIKLDPEEPPPPYPTRPKNYFKATMGPEQVGASAHNVKVFRELAE